MNFPDELAAFRARTTDPLYRGLIIIGTRQSVTAALLLGTLQVERVAFLLTDETKDMPNDVAAKLDRTTEGWTDKVVEENTTTDVYEGLKSILQDWHDIPRNTIAIDVTGGTKPMTVGLSKAAHVLGLVTVYIASDYGKEPNGRLVPQPGTQRLELLPDPYEVFGDLDRAEAERLYARHDYVGAERLFAQLAERLQKHLQPTYRAHALLADVYVDWDAFALKPAYEKLSGLLANPLPAVLETHRPMLTIQAKALKELSKVASSAAGKDRQARETLADENAVRSLLGSLHTNALRREAQQRYDAAALLRYRCLELISQHRLATYGVLTEQPNLQELQRRLPNLDDNYKSEQDKLDFYPEGLPRPNRNGFCKPITLLNGYILLAALGDELVQDYPLRTIKDRSQARNKSILAHGYRLINQNDYSLFATVVDDFTHRLLVIQGTSYADWQQEYTFLQPFGDQP